MFLKFFGKKSSSSGDGGYPGQIGEDVDTSMNYCPSCGDEYLPEIKDCVACGISLISGAEKLARLKDKLARLSARSMDILPEDEMVTIRRGNLMDIKNIQKLLAAEKIPANIVTEDGDCGGGCCSPFMNLQIRVIDQDEAMRVLAEDFVRSTGLDNHDLSHAEAVFDQRAKETVCPACGCKFSPTIGACPDCGLCFA